MPLEAPVIRATFPERSNKLVSTTMAPRGNS
jgi:hypothetical protein